MFAIPLLTNDAQVQQSLQEPIPTPDLLDSAPTLIGQSPPQSIRQRLAQWQAQNGTRNVDHPSTRDMQEEKDVDEDLDEQYWSAIGDGELDDVNVRKKF